MKKVKDEQGHQHVELTAQEARQGRLGRPVLYILIAGLAGAIVGVAAVGIWFA